MLARLQQITTVTLVGTALGWLLIGWSFGWRWLAIGGALLILFGYALILGLEFALMHWANRHDPLPAARLGEVCKAWIGEVRSAALVFCWRQPFRSRRYADRPSGAGGQRGLILAHGFICNRGIWNGWYPRLIERQIPFIGVNFEPIFGAIESYAQCIESAVTALRDRTGLAPVIVAHSMGGLAVRAWLREAGPDAVDRVHHIVTIGTPHGGTALARFAISANSRQMAHAGEWVNGLAGTELSALRERMTCIFSNCDHIVFPTSSALLPLARSVEIPACAHVALVDHPRAFDEVMSWLGSGAAEVDGVNAVAAPAPVPRNPSDARCERMAGAASPSAKPEISRASR